MKAGGKTSAAAKGCIEPLDRLGGWQKENLDSCLVQLLLQAGGRAHGTRGPGADDQKVRPALQEIAQVLDAAADGLAGATSSGQCGRPGRCADRW